MGPAPSNPRELRLGAPEGNGDRDGGGFSHRVNGRCKEAASAKQTDRNSGRRVWWGKMQERKQAARIEIDTAPCEEIRGREGERKREGEESRRKTAR